MSHIPFDEALERPTPIMFPVGERKLAWQMRTGNYEPLKSHKAIVRLSPSGNSAHVLNVVRTTYKLVLNRELYEMVHAAIQKRVRLAQLHDAYCVDKIAHYGRICWREYIFPSITCRVGNHVRPIAFRIIVQNSYGSSALRMHSGAIDFFCTNGMIRGEFESVYRRHTSGLVVGDLSENIDRALVAFADSESKWRRWSHTPVTREQTMMFFREIVKSPTLVDKLADRWLYEIEDRGQNLWSVYSTLTYYSSHNEGDFAVRTRDDAGVDAAMHQRELDVAKWVQHDAWRVMETA